MYREELLNWINQGSVDYGREVVQAGRWPIQISWTSLTRGQQTRGVRLFSRLKVAFAGHGRVSLMIQGFNGGLDIVAVAQQGEIFGNATTYMGNGFELLRQLRKEFARRSKSETLGLRTASMQKTCCAHAVYGAPVADTIGRLKVQWLGI